MNKTEFIKELSQKANLTQKDCYNCLNALTTLVSQTLKRGDNVTLVGFGKFEVKHRSERMSFNPQTRKKMMVPASITPAFKPGKSFKEAIS